MTLKKQNTLPWPLVFFGILSVLIIAAFTVLLVVLLRHHGRITPRSAHVPTEPIHTPEAVISTYKQALAELTTQLATAKKEEAPTIAESALLSMRVPVELLDSHMHALLTVKQAPQTDAGKKIIKDTITQLAAEANDV